MAGPFTMAEALRLTRSGNLVEATKLIQAALTAGDLSAVPPSGQTGGGVTELWPQRVALEASGSAERVKLASSPSGHADGASRFEERSYRGDQGPMRYRLYQPANVGAGAALVVMLHGCTQSSQDFANGTGMNRLADELGFLVAYPSQSRSAHPQKCWNWYRPGDQKRDEGEPALLAGITRELTDEFGLDAERVYIAGLSAGGAAAAIMAAEYPDLYAAVGIHSGLASGAARDLPSALAAMKRGGGAGGKCQPGRRFVPVITFHGDQDSTVHEVNSREIIAAASAAAGVPLEVRVEEGRSKSGRRFTRQSSVDPGGTVLLEQWTIEGSGHAWSGGNSAGSYTDPNGPNASREMLRFFLERKRG